MRYGVGFYVEEKSAGRKALRFEREAAKKPELNGASVHYRNRYLAQNQKPPAFPQQNPSVNELVVWTPQASV